MGAASALKALNGAVSGFERAAVASLSDGQVLVGPGWRRREEVAGAGGCCFVVGGGGRHLVNSMVPSLYVLQTPMIAMSSVAVTL